MLAGAAAAMDRAGAQTGNPADFSLEQLSSMEVSGVSKSAERVLNAPAAVTVITSDEIRAQGFRTLADVLNVAPGFFTYSDRAYSYVGIRGFAPIESFNSRVLLLVDGCPLNDDVFQQALLGNEAVVDLNLVDRIEIIPGPSSSVYGTNAFLGVINVITKTPAQVNSGGQAWFGSGAEHGASASLSAGAGENTRYLLQVSGMGSNGMDVVFAPQPGIASGARVADADGFDVVRAFAKVIHENLRLNFGFSERRQNAGFGLFGDVMGNTASFVADGTTFGDLRYDGTLGNSTDYALRASAAQYRSQRDVVDPYGNVPGFPPMLAGVAPITDDWVDTEATATHRFSPGNRLIVGAEVRRDLRERITYSNAFQGTFLDARRSDTRLGVYAQSDIEWSPHWSTSIGVRDDADSGQANRLNPRLALVWKPTADQALKLLAGTAFRDPSFWEKDFQQPPLLNLPNPSLVPERVHTLDLVYQAQVTALTSLSLTAFRYRAYRLIDNTVVNPLAGTLQYQNAAAAKAEGADLALDTRLLPTLRARLSAEYVFPSDDDGDRLENAPRLSGRLGLDQKLGGEWHLAAEALFEGRRLAIDNSSTLPSFVVANLAVSSVPHPGHPYFSLGLYNVFGRGYAQPVAGWQGDSVNQLGFTWRATVGYPF